MDTSASGSDLKTQGIKKWSTKELRNLVKRGMLTKRNGVTEHVALHPYWLDRPLQGIEEDLDHRLGRWVPRLGGYLVTYSDLRRDLRTPLNIHIDQPWIHVDVVGNFYVFRPEVGQVLQGVIKKLGNTAAICVVMEFFSVTVVPTNDFDISEWSIDSELEFRVTAVQNREKGPQIRAKCTSVLSFNQ